jgi:hypothetical protein
MFLMPGRRALAPMMAWFGAGEMCAAFAAPA